MFLFEGFHSFFCLCMEFCNLLVNRFIWFLHQCKECMTFTGCVSFRRIIFLKFLGKLVYFELSSSLSKVKLLYTSRASSPIKCINVQAFYLGLALSASRPVAWIYRSNICLNFVQCYATFPVGMSPFYWSNLSMLTYRLFSDDF